MNLSDSNDTIAAISTPIGESGIGIVRMSGESALQIADRVFVSKNGKELSDFKTYTTHYGWIVKKSQIRRHKPQVEKPEEVIDEVILTVMRSPRSYTREDIVEINCHGGIVALRRALDLILENGCRLAEPGEFTKRAFLNGRIDLAQAEAVLDIIRAKTDSALQVGQEQLRGVLSNEVNRAREILLEVLSVLETNIDFPDEDISRADTHENMNKLKAADNLLKDILSSADYGRVFREGISAVICGRTNVGKSSFLNALLRQERSIVTPVAGTTRDTVEEVIDIKGIPVKIIDTAGIIEPRDLVERKAVQRSKRYIAMADLVILVFDGSRRLAKEDEVLIRKLKNKLVLCLINKMDLKQKIERDRLMRRFGCLIDISAKKNKNINLFEDALAGLMHHGKIKSPESILVSNRRHIEKIKKAQKLIAEAANSLDNKLSPEFVSQDVRDALSCLDDMLGKSFSEDLLERIFSEFCIGK